MLTIPFNSSDADADVLADYVLALLRHDGDIDAVRQLCESEIPDFLKEDSSIFVRDVFDALEYKTYLPGGGVPRRPALPFAPPLGPSGNSYGNLGGYPQGPQNVSRKRSYNDREEGELPDREIVFNDSNGRYNKQPRTSWAPGTGQVEGGYRDPISARGRGGFTGGRASPMNLQHMPSPGYPDMPSPPLGMPPFDQNNPIAAMLAMQSMGILPPNMPGHPQATSPLDMRPSGPPLQMRKRRCRDYDEKGFCARGNTCMFEHDEHSIWVPSAQNQDEYDPANSTLMTGVETDGVPRLPPTFNRVRGYDRGRGRGFHRGESRQPSRGRGGRAEFSSDRPNNDRSNPTIVVEQIPEDKFSEDEVRAFFSEFGSITEVSMRPYKRLAIVKYDDWEAARLAYNSPKVIFDNRFVKVYWYKPESLPQPPSVGLSNGGAHSGTSTNSAIPATVPARETSEPRIDIEEFAKKQQEAQKVHEEKMKKKQEMETARKELEQRQADLLKSQAEERKKLMEKIAAKSGKSSNPPEGQEDRPSVPTEEKSNPQTEALKAQLAALEAEAQSLGIDTSLTDDGSWAGRGRGRGRGVYRGRGTYAPRGFRGGFRGRGAAPFAAGVRSFHLDNRTKKVVLTGTDFSDAEKDESLRQYLLVSPTSL